MRKNILCCFIFYTILGLFLSSAYATDLTDHNYIIEPKEPYEIKEPWIQAVPPSEHNTAAYMVIENKGNSELVLENVAMGIARVVEIHKMERINGIMKMSMLKNIKIPAKGKVVFAPGGYHLMLIDLIRPLKRGELIGLNLMFKDMPGMEVTFTVQDSPEDQNGH